MLENKASIIAVLYPGCIFFELALALELLSKRYEIIFATPDGLEHPASNGATLRAQTSYKLADLSNFKAVLVPGGNPDSVKDNTDLDLLLQNANKKEIWLAAICAGPVLLAKAGILKGKRIAHGYGSQQLEFLKSYFEGVELTNEKWICDGNILTAKPDAHIDFAVELACHLGAIESSQNSRFKYYYRGALE